MLIRILKSLPAPLMDGFDVRGFRVEQVYDVEPALGRYLTIAGYGEPLDDNVRLSDEGKKRVDVRKRSSS